MLNDAWGEHRPRAFNALSADDAIARMIANPLVNQEGIPLARAIECPVCGVEPVHNIGGGIV
jgi:hypothetical protein